MDEVLASDDLQEKKNQEELERQKRYFTELMASEAFVWYLGKIRELHDAEAELCTFDEMLKPENNWKLNQHVGRRNAYRDQLIEFNSYDGRPQATPNS